MLNCWKCVWQAVVAEATIVANPCRDQERPPGLKTQIGCVCLKSVLLCSSDQAVVQCSDSSTFQLNPAPVTTESPGAVVYNVPVHVTAMLMVIARTTSPSVTDTS
jgi:hypothetical protein